MDPENYRRFVKQAWIDPQIFKELQRAQNLKIPSTMEPFFQELKRAQRFNIGSVADQVRIEPELILGKQWIPEISKLSRFPIPALNALTCKNEEVVRATRDIVLGTNHIKEYLGASYLSDFQRTADSVSRIADFSPKVLSSAQQIALQSSGLQDAMAEMASELSRMPMEQIRTQFADVLLQSSGLQNAMAEMASELSRMPMEQIRRQFADVLLQSTTLFSNPEFQRAIGRVTSEGVLREVMESAREAGITFEEDVEEEEIHLYLPEIDWRGAAKALYPPVKRTRIAVTIAFPIIYTSAESDELKIAILALYSWLSALEEILKAAAD